MSYRTLHYCTHSAPLRVCTAPLIDSSPPLSKGDLMRAQTSPKPPRGVYAPHCSHCGTPRLVAPLQIFVGLNRRDPLPGMAEVLSEMSGFYTPNTPVAICPQCMCISADFGAHTH